MARAGCATPDWQASSVGFCADEGRLAAGVPIDGVLDETLYIAGVAEMVDFHEGQIIESRDVRVDRGYCPRPSFPGMRTLPRLSCVEIPSRCIAKRIRHR